MNNKCLQWSNRPVGELLEEIIDYRGKTPPKSQSGIPVLTAANVRNGRVLLSDVSYISQETYNKWTTRGFPKPGDVLITTEAPVGEVASFPGDRTYLITRRLMALRGKKGELDNDFLKYSFLYKGNIERLLAATRGSTVPRVLKTDITGLEIPIPPYEEQKTIAHILGMLDDKIELNRQMNSTLEQIAQALFKRWFIDFEFPDENGKPYKSSGGRMVDSELGKIPEGWGVGTLGEFASISSGKRPKQKSECKTKEFNVPLMGASSIMGYVNEILYNEPVLVIGRVGTHGIVQRTFQPSYPSDNTLVIRSKYHEYVYQILNSIDYSSLNVGSTQPLITQTSVKNSKIVIPNESLLDIFEKISVSIFSKINSNNIENQKLSDVRDFLLPKLMSGKIRVGI